MRFPYFSICVLFAVMFVGGCSKSETSSAQKPQANSSDDDRKRDRRGEPDAKQEDLTKNLAKLSDEDRALAEQQKTCPIGKGALGAMGVPVKLTIKDQSFFICCDHCKASAEKTPDETLEKVAALLKGKGELLAAEPREVTKEPVAAKKEADEKKDEAKEEEEKIKKNLAKLPEADRKLAEEQKMCPIEDEPLGSMGVPIKLTIKGKTVFICCKGCKDTAEKKADETLNKVAELVKKNKKK